MKILVADDSILFRRVMAEVLAALPDVEVVGQAANGKIALQKIQDLKPDILTLDMEMPEMDGLAVLDALKATKGAPAVIVVSALTKQGGNLTLQALQKGAFDFITKPASGSAEQSREALRADLAPRIRALSLRLGVRNILRSATTPFAAATPGFARSVSACRCHRGCRGRGPAHEPAGRHIQAGVGGDWCFNRRTQCAGRAVAHAAGKSRGSGIDCAAHAAALHPVAGGKSGDQVCAESARSGT